ncbi:hypothetical protein [Gluconobacter cerinus]|uniref:Uncharacterized protein n=1 Tax=Gluconobacter cerinus TaxID=38307 RepID=A0AAV5NC02_9PROT|nr:hypothetical protein [Gluconobacter cerinus]GBR03231.1 hypothetical protein AA0229_1892 [Gluconobacter cerinus NRIC 0229]GLQ61575.1 hypothetical protein GCM10007867_04200 [Gluconobacter cerinus]
MSFGYTPEQIRLLIGPETRFVKAYDAALWHVTHAPVACALANQLANKNEAIAALLDVTRSRHTRFEWQMRAELHRVIATAFRCKSPKFQIAYEGAAA